MNGVTTNISFPSAISKAVILIEIQSVPDMLRSY